VTLSDKRVQETLAKNFVCGWKNIKGEKFAGLSHDHPKDAKPAEVNNGSGFRNVQIFVTTPDGHVVHCLPGYWKPEVLLRELELAQTLAALWKDGSLSLKQKAERFTDAHLSHVKEHPDQVARQSALPHFDQSVEKVRKNPDTTRASGEVKMADQIVHEKMAERPFMASTEFDTAAFTNVGQGFYDAGSDG
jgi:hypothetical protein